MAKAYSNDLRQKFLQAYDRGRQSLRELAQQYCVSLGWAKKISARRTRTGQIDYQPHRRGPQRRVTEEVRQWLRDQIQAQADLTLVELQQKLAAQRQVTLSTTRIWQVLKELGLRLKKSRSTPGNRRRRRPSSSGARGIRRFKR